MEEEGQGANGKGLFTFVLKIRVFFTSFSLILKMEFERELDRKDDF